SRARDGCARHLDLLCFFLLVPLPPRSPLFPYTTLFRSGDRHVIGVAGAEIAAQQAADPGDIAFRRRAIEAELPAQQLCRLDRRRSEEHTSELQSRENLVCRLLLEKKKKIHTVIRAIGDD